MSYLCIERQVQCLVLTLDRLINLLVWLSCSRDKGKSWLLAITYHHLPCLINFGCQFATTKCGKTSFD